MVTTHETGRAARPDYGYDAPGIMLGLSIGGAAALAAGIMIVVWTGGDWRIVGGTIAVAGAVPLFFGLLMLVYAFAGKRRTRDHLLHLAMLHGTETVLDVGAGAGVLLVGAAKRLPRGRAIGVDLWVAKDLSNNAAAATARNIAIEGVADRTEIITGDARDLPLPDASVDRVVSLLCLHNIEDKADQALACREIARVLKPGGRVVIGDYVPTHAYADALAAAGLTIIRSRAAFDVALSLMWVLVADKPAADLPTHGA